MYEDILIRARKLKKKCKKKFCVRTQKECFRFDFVDTPKLSL